MSLPEQPPVHSTVNSTPTPAAAADASAGVSSSAPRFGQALDAQLRRRTSAWRAQVSRGADLGHGMRQLHPELEGLLRELRRNYSLSEASLRLVGQVAEVACSGLRGESAQRPSQSLGAVIARVDRNHRLLTQLTGASAQELPRVARRLMGQAGAWQVPWDALFDLAARLETPYGAQMKQRVQREALDASQRGSPS